MAAGLHDPGSIDQIVRHGGPKVPGEVHPHERELDQPKALSYSKPWERRRRNRVIVGIVVVLALAALAGLVAFVDESARQEVSSTSEGNLTVAERAAS